MNVEGSLELPKAVGPISFTESGSVKLVNWHALKQLSGMLVTVFGRLMELIPQFANVLFER